MKYSKLTRDWMNSQIPKPRGISYHEHSKDVLRKIISDNGDTPVSNHRSDLLRQALSSLGFTPERSDYNNFERLRREV